MASDDKAPLQLNWLEEFDAREQKCIDHARLYASQYDHGDPGHMHMKVIAKLAALLDRELMGLKVEYTIDRNLVDISNG